MITVYAIESSITNYIYVGMSNNLERKLIEHNAGRNNSTKAYLPYVILFQEEFENRKLARQKEIYLKSGIGKEFLKRLSKN